MSSFLGGRSILAAIPRADETVEAPWAQSRLAGSGLLRATWGPQPATLAGTGGAHGPEPVVSSVSTYRRMPSAGFYAVNPDGGGSLDTAATWETMQRRADWIDGAKAKACGWAEAVNGLLHAESGGTAAVNSISGFLLPHVGNDTGIVTVYLRIANYTATGGNYYVRRAVARAEDIGVSPLIGTPSANGWISADVTMDGNEPEPGATLGSAYSGLEIYIDGAANWDLVSACVVSKPRTALSSLVTMADGSEAPTAWEELSLAAVDAADRPDDVYTLRRIRRQQDHVVDRYCRTLASHSYAANTVTGGVAHVGTMAIYYYRCRPSPLTTTFTARVYASVDAAITANRGAWTTATGYSLGDKVSTTGGGIYICTTAITLSDTEPTDLGTQEDGDGFWTHASANIVVSIGTSVGYAFVNVAATPAWYEIAVSGGSYADPSEIEVQTQCARTGITPDTYSTLRIYDVAIEDDGWTDASIMYGAEVAPARHVARRDVAFGSDGGAIVASYDGGSYDRFDDRRTLARNTAFAALNRTQIVAMDHLDRDAGTDRNEADTAILETLWRAKFRTGVGAAGVDFFVAWHRNGETMDADVVPEFALYQDGVFVASWADDSTPNQQQAQRWVLMFPSASVEEDTVYAWEIRARWYTAAAKAITDEIVLGGVLYQERPRTDPA